MSASLAEDGADVRGMFERIAPRYDAANRVMSAGVDIIWRKRAITRLIEGLGETPRFLDLGAGTLDGALEITRRVPGARVAAADFARAMLVAGGHKLAAGQAIDRHAADGHHLPYRAGAFDGAFSAFCIRNLSDLPLGLRELRRVVRPGGRVVLLEFLRPEIAQTVFLEGVGGDVADLVVPHLAAGAGEHQAHLHRRGERDQRVEQPLRVDRPRRAADRDHQLHDATTMVATPDGNSALVSTDAKPTSPSSAASSAGERKRAIESGR